MADCGFLNTCGWFRYRAAAIIIEDGHILMVKNEKDPYYYSVGGGVHQNETAEAAVCREVLEETGVEYEIERLAYIHENFFLGTEDLEGVPCHEVALYFLMKPRGTRELPSNKSYGIHGDREHMVWLPIKDFSNFYAYPSFFADKLLNMKEAVEHIVTREY